MSGRLTLIVLWAVLLTSFVTVLSAQERWVYRYNGPGNWADGANAIVMGPDGNLYSTGYSYGIGTLYDFTVISLTPSGGERWVYRYNGPGKYDDRANSIAVGSDGNLYAAGVSSGSGTSYDFTVISLTESGVERWIYQYNGLGSDWDEACSIVIGSDGNLYAAGMSYGNGTSYDFTVISLTESGVERWVYEYNGPGNHDDLANSIVMGSDGNLYAAGYSCGMGTSYDFTVISLTESGVERWVYRYNGPLNASDLANSIVMGSDGNVYTAGMSSNVWQDFTVISLTPSGALLWGYRYNGPGYYDDEASSIVVGSDGNLYAAGYSYGSGTYSDFTVISLTDSGAIRWVYRYNGPANLDDAARSIVMGSDGNIYAAGMSWGAWQDFTVISLTESGVERWVYRYSGPRNSDDGACSIVMGSDDNLYAAGWSEGSGTSHDFTVISLTPVVGVEEKVTSPERSQREARLELSTSPVPALNGVEIYYSLPKNAQVKLSIYDVCGRLVRNLVNAREESGPKAILWDARDSEGRRVTSGTYLVKLQTSTCRASQKLIIF